MTHCLKQNSILTIVHVEVDDEPDEEKWSSYQCYLDIIPKVGEYVEFLSTRNERGDYLHDREKDGFFARPKHIFCGIVTKITHCLEEQGEDSKSWRMRHYITVHLKKCKQQDL